jgi:hypothetical protein
MVLQRRRPTALSNRASRRGWPGHRPARVRCFTRNGHDWADRFPAIVDLPSASNAIVPDDGEAVIARDDGRPDERGRAAIAVAFNYRASRAASLSRLMTAAEGV